LRDIWRGHGRTGKTQAGPTGGLRQASSWGTTDPTLTRPPSTTFATASTSPCTTYSWASSSSPPLPSLCSSLPHVTLRSHGPENTKDIIGLIQAGSREPTSGLEPLTCSLEVIHRALQGFARGCKCRIFREVSFLCLAQRCTVLRSQWCQSGVNIAPVVRARRTPGELVEHLLGHARIIMTLDHYSR